MSMLHGFLVVNFVRRITNFFYKPMIMVFHKCLTYFFDKIMGKHVGNTILVDHNHVRVMKSPIENVMLVEKWNRKVEVSSTYVMG
jgi:hypothetical protein